MAKRDQLTKGPSIPYVHPGVPNGALDAYNAGIAARRAANPLPKDTTPVAGGPPTRIPRLDGAPTREGLSMAQHAAIERGPSQVVQQPTTVFVEPPVRAQASNQAPSPAQLGIMPVDVLPEEAKKDPKFREGHGSMFAVNQPELAMKYGVIRNGRLIPPQKLGGENRQTLRAETVRDLQELQRLQQESAVPNVHTTEAEADGSVSDGARAAGTVGNLPGDTSERPLTKEERDQLNEAVRNMDEFEFDQWRQAMMKDLLNSPEQQAIIESRLKPMDVGDLIIQNFVLQRVPVIPGKFELDFRSTDGETDLAIKRLIMEDAKSLEVSERYYLDRYSLMALAAALYAVNGKVMPDYRDAQGNFNDDLFRSKFTKLLKFPLHMLASVGIQSLWFDMRVRKLFVAEKLGNG